METNNEVPKPVSQEQLMLEILAHVRSTKRIMQWQLYITVALVVLPLLGALVMIPMVMRSLSTIYQLPIQ